MKEWEGTIEKEFTIVLYVDRKLDENKNTIAWFDTCLPNTSCKCPPDIIKDIRIDNDCNLVLQRINEFIK